MSYLVDTSVLIRYVTPDDPLHSLIVSTVDKLEDRGHVLCFTPQTAREAWSVMTRPLAANGFGLSLQSAAVMLEAIEDSFDFFDDVPGIFAKWRELVEEHKVIGKQIHDANHVAAMLTHGISNVLTLDDRDFRRYPVITVVRPDIQ